MAPAIFFINDENGTRIAALRTDGLVTEAKVVGKRKVQEAYTDRKGRSKTTTASYIDLEYDSQTSQSYMDWLTTGEKAQAAGQGVAMSTYAYRSDGADYDAVKPGDTVPVVIHRYERTRAELATVVKAFNTLTLQLSALLIGLFGLGCGYMALRAHRKS
jgi:predicted glutamine amidotransferase